MEPAASQASPWRDAIALGVAALIYRLAFAWAMPRTIDAPDALGYLDTAARLAQGDLAALGVNLPLLYPILVAPLVLLGVELEAAGELVSLVAGVAAVPALYALARPVFGRPAAFLAGAALAIWPWYADYSWRIAPDGLALTLWIASLAVLLRALRTGGRWPLVAGFALFALHLARPEGTVLLVASVVPAALLAPSRGDFARRFGVTAGTAGVALLVQALVMRLATGGAVVNPRVADPAASVRYMLLDRGAESARALFTLGTEIWPLMAGPYLVIFAGYALLRPDARRDYRGEAALIALMLCQWIAAGLSTYAEPRYLLAPVALTACWAARGLVETTAALRVSAVPWVRGAAPVPVALLVLWMAFLAALTVLPEHLGRLPRMPHEYRLAGAWLRDHGEPGLIITRQPQIAFYAGMTATGPGADESLEALVARAQRIGARYLVVDERYGTSAAPALAPLLDPANAPDALRLLRDDLSPYRGGRLVLYEILAP